MNKPQQRIKITPDYLINNNYMYKTPGVQGTDMWQGIGYWLHKGTGFTLRGDKQVSQPLKLTGYFNSKIEYVDELITLYNLLHVD